jgi:hypothetical protein
VQFAATWLPYVVGALNQLVQPGAWLTSDPTVLEQQLVWATRIIEMFGTASGCPMVEVRLTSECVLQVSNDSGSTWVDATDWAANFGTCVQAHVTLPVFSVRLSDCVLQESSDGGSTWTDVLGWDGFCVCVQNCESPIGIPPVPPGGPSGDQLTCNLAWYLVNEVLILAIQKQIANVAADNILFNVAHEIALTLVGVGFVWTEVFISAVQIIYNAVQGELLTDMEAAITDVNLLHDLQCCIYSNIRATGQVSEANFPGILSCISAITYSEADVLGVFHDFIEAIGWRGLAALGQPAGSVVNQDCTDCLVPAHDWCRDFDFTVSNYTWNTSEGRGDYIPGYGFNGNGTIGFDSLVAVSPGFASTTIVAIELWWASGGHADSTAHRKITYDSGTPDLFYHGLPLSGPASFHTLSVATHAMTVFRVWLENNPTTGGGASLFRAKVYGLGAMPFGSTVGVSCS